MKYDFDKIINRRGTNCFKYDEMPNDDTIALWVADMDFETFPGVTDALKERLNHGCFGYTMVPDSYYQASIDWFSQRHGWHGIQKEWFIYTTGVVPAVSAILKAVTLPGEKVLMHTPAYNCFYSCLRNNGCVLEEIPFNPEDPAASIEALESYLVSCDTSHDNTSPTTLLLCNPHNPTGHVWTRQELTRIAEICQRHHIFVIADEIHCEFVNPALGRDYVPFATVAENLSPLTAHRSPLNYCVCVSPSKAFNIAGLQIANIICPDECIRQRIDRAINIHENCDVNPFGVIALQKAYTPEGAEWLDQLNDYIYGNYEWLKNFIEKNIPQWQVIPLEGTYLLWVKVNQACHEPSQMNADALCQKILLDANVYINSGSMYGSPSTNSGQANNHIRINLATQRPRLEEAFNRILKVL